MDSEATERREDIVNVITNFSGENYSSASPPSLLLVARCQGKRQGRKEKRLRGLMQMQVINFANPISPAQRS